MDYEEITEDLVSNKEKLTVKLSVLNKKSVQIRKLKKDLKKEVAEIDHILNTYSADVYLKPVNRQRDKALAIASVVAEYFGLSVEDIYKKRPKGCVKRDISRARQINSWLIKNRTTLILKDIGTLVPEGYDHSSVVAQINFIENEIALFKLTGKDNESILENISRIEKIIDGE